MRLIEIQNSYVGTSDWCLLKCLQTISASSYPPRPGDSLQTAVISPNFGKDGTLGFVTFTRHSSSVRDAIDPNNRTPPRSLAPSWAQLGTAGDNANV